MKTSYEDGLWNGLLTTRMVQDRDLLVELAPGRLNFHQIAGISVRTPPPALSESRRALESVV